MKRVLLIVFLSLPLGIAAYDHSLHPSLQKLYGAKHSQVSAGSFEIPRSVFQRPTTAAQRGRTRLSRMLALQAMVHVTNQLEAAESQDLNSQSQQQQEQQN